MTTTKELQESGFTLTEALVAVVILGVLSSVALPNFFRQIQATCQAEAASQLELLASAASAFKDIYGKAPETWNDLNSISAVMTTEGLANEKYFQSDLDDEGEEQNSNAGKGNLTNEITIPSCDYKLSRSTARSGEEFILNAVPTPNIGDKSNFNIMSCFDLENWRKRSKNEASRMPTVVAPHK